MSQPGTWRAARSRPALGTQVTAPYATLLAACRVCGVSTLSQTRAVAAGVGDCPHAWTDANACTRKRHKRTGDDSWQATMSRGTGCATGPPGCCQPS
jgi:hypothetical protein